MTRVITLSLRDYDAVLFDLDGVLTDTARVHAVAWKALFDAFLERRSEEKGERFVPFDIEGDYRRHVDGKPRLDGVAAFLASRGIDLPLGTPADAAGTGSMQALGKLKDAHFLRHLERDGVDAYEPAIALVRALRAEDVATAVVSSSNNCAAVLSAAGISELFDARVDGRDLTRLALRGKPAPDAFLEAARRLAVEPSRAVVVEDALAGVEAGRAGRFGCVMGIDHGGRSMELRAAGADVVVETLAQVRLAEEPASAWSLAFEGFEPASEGRREALCTVGNGYFATRGAAPGAVADGVHYPGTYLASGYDRLLSHVDGRTVENEDLVNFPNWLALSFRIGDGGWFDARRCRLLSYRQELDLRRGVLVRKVRFEDGDGRRTALAERRLVSMHDRHVAALEVTLTAENWSAPVTFRSGIDGRVVNAGAQLYRRFEKAHLVPIAAEVVGEEGVCLLVRTRQSGIHVAQAARTQMFLDGERRDAARQAVTEPGYVAQDLTVAVPEGATLAVEKLVSFFTSRDPAISECALEARKGMARVGRFGEVMASHVRAWKQLWRRFDVRIAPAAPGGLNVVLLLRLNMFHLLEAVSTQSIGLDMGVPARGWTGEAYQGHIFWDELFIFPFFNHRLPEITRSLLMYRYRRLGEARAAARKEGYRGAMFPWQSGSNGEEVTQASNLNPRSGRWVTDNSYLQRHVGSAIAYNVWQYYQVTRDAEFLEAYGAELFLEIARFWASMARLDEERGRYVIRGVLGPDEFHDAYPGAPTAGLDDNAYTNVMAAWVLWRAKEVLDLLSVTRRSELAARVGITSEELARWDEVSRRMFVPFHDGGIISQFHGYERLRELDWDDYRTRYGNIQRLDLILEAEGDTVNRYKASKQADVLMLLYLFSADELAAILERLGYRFERDTIPRIVDYYTRRTSHGSTLSRVVHAWVLARSDRPRALRFFAEALQSDVADIQQGTTAEGIHLGAMAGTVDLVERVSTGIELTGDVLRLDPQLPREIDRVDLRVRYRGLSLELRVTRDALTVRARDRAPAPIRLKIGEDVHEFAGGGTRMFRLGEK
ncbi:MAG TPA: beta-phosphoglucomutase family hydrolase [Anaeromyxobacteraceae bacterium]|nr:beta-phosphoglucomutase family hydrolase [Anaeromyxobacteraceae bacterium]